MIILKILAVGWVVLLGALAINAVALKLNIATWYEFTGLITKSGLSYAFQKSNIQSLFFLFVLYPLLLGALAYLGLKIFKLV